MSKKNEGNGAIGCKSFGFVIDNVILDKATADNTFKNLNDMESDQPAEESLMDLVLDLHEKMDALNAKLDLIFGNSILIDGKFLDISNLK